jgi:hypothetical protein
LLCACRFAEEADRLALALGGRFTHRVVPLECSTGAALGGENDAIAGQQGGAALGAAGGGDDTIGGQQEAVAAAAAR